MHYFYALFLGFFLSLGGITPNNPDLKPLVLTKDLEISAMTEQVLAGDFSSVAIDRKGKFYLVDEELQQIHAFSRDGKYLASMARKGYGPGEFEYMNPNISINGNKLYAFQENARKIEIFDISNFQHLKTVKIPRKTNDGSNLGDAEFLIPLEDGSMIVYFYDPQIMAPKEGTANKYATIAKIDTNGNLIDQNYVQRAVPFPSDQKVVYMADGFFIYKVPFYPDLRIASDSEGNFYFGKSDESRIQKYNSEFLLTAAFNFEKNPASFTDSHFKELINTYHKTFKDAINEIGLPEVWPVYDYFIVDDNGNLWLKLVEPDNELQNWWVFDASGNPKWEAQLPAEVDLYAIQQNKAYGISTPDEGIPSFVRYEVSGLE